MEGNGCYMQTQPPGQRESLESRVSTLPISEQATGRCSNAQPSDKGLRQHKLCNDLQDTVCFMSQQMAKPEKGDTQVTTPTAEGNYGINSPKGQNMANCVECDAKLYQEATQENHKKNGILCQEMSEPERCAVGLSHSAGEQIEARNKCTELYQSESVGDCQKSDCMGQVMDQPEEFDIKFPQLVRKENDEKCSFMGEQKFGHDICDNDTELPQCFKEEIVEKGESNANKKLGKYFYYETPLPEETGYWIPVSVPPLSESEHEDWNRGLYPNGGYFPEGDTGWSQYAEEDKELTMWDVVVEMLLAARGKVSAITCGDIRKISWISSHLVEQAWKEMAETLTEANYSNTMEILEADPPKWLPDSAASACMLCSTRFHPIMCTRHHCRFCGGVFCGECTRGRSLLPAKFQVADPQRVCDVCFVRLESVQPYLMDQVSHAAQLPTHDVTDLSTLRSWVNFPWGQSMEYEIYKATNTIRGYIEKVGSLKPEKAIPDAILRQAEGLAILTVVKVGMMVTYNVGTGLAIGRREDGSWSPPSAISSFGVGWGAQAGGELMDLIIVLRTKDAVKIFSGDAHLSVGAGMSAAVGTVGRAVEADVRAGDGGYAACYTYSCSKGAFVGCSLEGSVVTTRTRENSRFYGSQSINASDILLGLLPRPPAAAILYRALGDLYQKLEK